LLGSGENAGAAQPMDRWMIGVVGVDIPLVLLDLGGDPLLPAAAKLAAFFRAFEPAAPARADRRRYIGRPSANRDRGLRGSDRSVLANASS
jgi:hypothetical protein